MVYGIDIDNQYYTAIAGLPLNSPSDYFFEQQSHFYLDLENLLSKDKRTIFEMRGNLFLALLPTQKSQKVTTTIQQICQLLEQKYHITLIFGAGTPGKGHGELKKSIDQAKTALSWNKHFSHQQTLAFTDMAYGLVLHDVNAGNKSYFLNNLFNDLPKQDIEHMLSLLDTYESCNGSIKQCAETLFIHKNTVQYQLNKITDLTGYDPRVLSDFFTLKLASILYKLQD
ncbi:PucR family transcriptional regulator [Streptococcus hillyeri]|nr:helix-turn-helix domain-containing protein [Streptococcus hillyeri]